MQPKLFNAPEGRVDRERATFLQSVVAVILILGLSLLLALVCISPDPKNISAWSTAIGAAAAGLYFSYRLISGEFWSGVSLDVTTERRRDRRNHQSDWLAIRVRVRNERSGRVELRDAIAVVRGAHTDVIALGEGFHRYRREHSSSDSSRYLPP